MERFVIGAAVAVAVLIAAGSVFGRGFSEHGGLVFDIDSNRSSAPIKGTGAPSATEAKTYASDELKVRNAVAVLKVIPEDRADISIEISNPGRLATPKVRMDGDTLIVDGDVGRRIRNCSGSAQNFSVTVSGVGDLAMNELPVITARVPRDVDLSVGGAVATEIASSSSADLSFTGCGPSTIADVANELDMNAAGSGDVVAGAAGSASVTVAGSGGATLGAVRGKFDASAAGSGDIIVASVAGPLDVSIAGSGDVTVQGGKVADADVSIAGSGAVEIAGDVGKLVASIMGSGDVTVRGAAQSVDADIMGSGDVRVMSVAGGVQKTVMGSGAVSVGPIEEN